MLWQAGVKREEFVAEVGADPAEHRKHRLHLGLLVDDHDRVYEPVLLEARRIPPQLDMVQHGELKQRL